MSKETLSFVTPPPKNYKISSAFSYNFKLALTITYLIKEIQIYPNGESKMPLKSIEFNFPIYIDGKEVRKVLWERGNTVETVCLLSKLKAVHHTEQKSFQVI